MALRSPNTARPIAVDDIARPSEHASASGHGTPKSRATPVISAALAPTCTVPQPKIGRRIAHKRRGSSSRPTRNSISTTPNSATDKMVCASVTSFSPHGANGDAGAEVADDRAEAERARQRHRDHGGGEVDQAGRQPGGVSVTSTTAGEYASGASKRGALWPSIANAQLFVAAGVVSSGSA